ncbi:uncharacterized protein [Parasteatoda tepidariorum]|uniref:uncharacterized protein n=1 Tax=Parasteatoda tepidariorum TaxID=114398 RepID=UPI0039BC2B8B
MKLTFCLSIPEDKPACSLNPSEDLPEVFFHFNLSASVNKKEFLPDLLKQLALEIIHSVPKQDANIFTDGNKIDSHAGSGVYVETPDEIFSLCQRNPDFCSVFRSELLAINRGLEFVLQNDLCYKDLWIFSDSHSSLQHLNNRTQIGDKTSISIVNNLKLLSLQHNIHLQWVPSHVGIYGNDLADSLAKEGCSQPHPTSYDLTYLELFSLKKSQLLRDWLISPTHHWYKGNKPGASSTLPFERRVCTTISRLATGHLKSLLFSEGTKAYPLCPKCHLHRPSADHILNCLGLLWEDIYSTPFLVFDFLQVNGFIDLA